LDHSVSPKALKDYSSPLELNGEYIFVAVTNFSLFKLSEFTGVTLESVSYIRGDVVIADD